LGKISENRRGDSLTHTVYLQSRRCGEWINDVRSI